MLVSQGSKTKKVSLYPSGNCMCQRLKH